MNITIFLKEIKFVVKNLSKKKTPGGSDDCLGKFYQIFKEEITPILHISSRKWKRREHFTTHFMGTGLMPKIDKGSTRKVQTNIQYPS